MNTIKKRITTNTQLIKGLLTNYINTFSALCELINNSIQAKASEISITIDYDDTGLTPAMLKSIVITDNGYGVCYSEFDKKVLNIGTTVKEGGQGIGRFGALQIGSSMEIETVAYDEAEGKFSKVKFPLNADEISDQLNEIDFTIEYDYLAGQHNPYYKIIIKDSYHNSQEKMYATILNEKIHARLTRSK
jgi:hypothetical protein